MEEYRETGALNEVTKWAIEKGCDISPKVKFMESALGLGSALIASEDVGLREPVVSCPESIMISHRVAKKTFGDAFDAQLMQPFIKLALVAEWLKGDRSEWAPYMKIIPQPGQLDLPAFYNEEELTWLQGTNLMIDIEVKLNDWTEEYEKAYERLPEVIDDGLKKEQFTRDLYLWACGVFNSRSFPAKTIYPGIGDTISILVPAVDFINHELEAAVHWNCMHETRFTLAPARVVHPGEIFNNYGPKSNEEFLFGYGFCILDNPHDTASLKLPANIPKELIQQTIDAGYILRDDLVFFLTKHEPLPPALQTIFRLLVAYNNGLKDPHTPAVTVRSLELLKSSLKKKLDSVNSVNLPSNPSKGHKYKYSRIYRLSQAALFESALEAADKAISDTIKNNEIKVYDLDVLHTDPKNHTFLKTACAAFTGEEIDDPKSCATQLINVGVEDFILILYLALHPPQATTEAVADPTSLQSMYDDMVTPLVQLDGSTFPRESLQPEQLAHASDLLETFGFSYGDDFGRERYRVLI